MEPDLFSPDVLECYRHIDSAKWVEKPRRMMDYELDYNLSGGRILLLDGKTYSLDKDSIVFRRPGQVAYSFGPFDIYALTLDFSHKRGNIPNARQTAITAQEPGDSFFLRHFPVVLKPICAPQILSIYQDIAHLCLMPERISETRELSAALIHILTAELYLSHIPPSTSQTVSEAVIHYFEEHYMEKITIETLSALTYLSGSYLVRTFKKETGESPIDFLNRMRLRNAVAMLRRNPDSISEVAYRCGFESTSYFIYRFKKEYGITPGTFHRGCNDNKDKALPEL